MHIFTVTVTNSARPSRVKLFVYNTDKVSFSQIVGDILLEIHEEHPKGKGYVLGGSTLKFLSRCLESAISRKFDTFYNISTRGNLRISVMAKEIE